MDLSRGLGNTIAFHTDGGPSSSLSTLEETYESSGTVSAAAVRMNSSYS